MLLSMEPAIEISISSPQASAPCGTDSKFARFSSQENSDEAAVSLNDAAAPIDLAVALESACWDLDFLVCSFFCFFLSCLAFPCVPYFPQSKCAILVHSSNALLCTNVLILSWFSGQYNAIILR
jgi:hypothetical protein